MKTRIALLTMTLMLLTLALTAWAQTPTMTTGRAIYHDTSPPLRDMAISAISAASAVLEDDKEVPIREKPSFGRDPSQAAPDGGLQSDLTPILTPILLARSHAAALAQRRRTVGARQHQFAQRRYRASGY